MLGTSRDNLCPLVDTLASKQPRNSLKTASKWSFSKQFYDYPDRSEEELRSSVKQHKYHGMTHICISSSIGVMVSIDGSYPEGPWFNPRSEQQFFSFLFFSTFFTSQPRIHFFFLNLLPSFFCKMSHLYPGSLLRWQI